MGTAGFEEPVEAELPCSTNFELNPTCSTVAVSMHHGEQKCIFFLPIGPPFGCMSVFELHRGPRVHEEIPWRVLFKSCPRNSALAQAGVHLAVDRFKMPLNLFVNNVFNFTQTKCLALPLLDFVNNFVPIFLMRSRVSCKYHEQKYTDVFATVISPEIRR